MCRFRQTVTQPDTCLAQLAPPFCHTHPTTTQVSLSLFLTISYSCTHNNTPTMMISATNPVNTGNEAKSSAEQQHQQQQQQEDTNASSQLQQQDQQVDEQQHSMPSMPWTIGATEGNIPVSPPPSPGLLDQLGGLLRGTPSPPPFVSTPKNGAVIGQATSPPPTPTTPKQPNLQSLSSKQQQNQQQQQQQHEHWKFQSTATSVESVLGAACHVMGFDIAEVWLRTGPKTHQLINSHLRPTALEDTVREDLVSVYYGERASERTHRLSPALCKRAKEANDVVWVTAQTDESALRLSISDVRTAVAIPVCHQPTHTNLTVIFFSIKRCVSYLYMHTGCASRASCPHVCALTHPLCLFSPLFFVSWLEPS